MGFGIPATREIGDAPVPSPMGRTCMAGIPTAPGIHRYSSPTRGSGRVVARKMTVARDPRCPLLFLSV